MSDPPATVERMANAKCKCSEHAGEEGWHGTPSGYVHHGCRCELCSDAWLTYCRKLYREKHPPRRCASPDCAGYSKTTSPYCAACLKSRPQSARVPEVQCIDCGASFERTARRGPLPKRCEPCRKAAHNSRHGPYRKESRKVAYEKAKAVGFPGRADAVACRGGCGKRVLRSRGSSEQPLCRDCGRDGAEWRRRACAREGCSNPVPGSDRTYCSRECAGNVEREERPCENCGQSFRPTEGSSGRFCTHECYSASMVTRKLPAHGVLIPLRACEECGREFLARRNVLCSAECRRLRRNRLTLASIMDRYRNDPEFRDLMISKAQNRRADRLGLDTITSPASLTAFLMERDEGICGICNKPVDEVAGPMRPSIDHIVPLARGGEHTIENLQLAHYRCNLSKGARL